MGLKESLGTLPSGNVVTLSNDDVTKFLREKYIFADAERARQKQSRNRLLLYRDQGKQLVEDMVTALFRNLKVRQLRKEFVKYAMFQNVSRRIVREISMVYSSEAIRTVSDRNESYQQVIRDSRQDRKMRSVNRYTNLLNECLVWFDLRDGEPVIRVITPDKFWAICHPNDPTHHVGSIVNIASNGMYKDRSSPHYLVITDEEFFKLDEAGRMLSDTYQKHGLGVSPALLVHREEPEDKLLDSSSGEDLISAHLAVALLNTLMLKQAKSGERVVAASGDLSTTPQGQPLDQEVIQSFGEGVSLSTLDLAADPAGYIQTARSVIKQVAANYGIPESVFDLTYAASSGFEIELKRSQLREVRQDQILDYRPVERSLAKIQSKVLIAAGHRLRFSDDGFFCNFGEIDSPREPMQQLLWFEKMRSMGLINTAEMFMRLNPEMDAERAQEQLLINARMESSRVQLLRSLNISTNATPEDPGQGPEDNGRLRLVGNEPE